MSVMMKNEKQEVWEEITRVREEADRADKKKTCPRGTENDVRGQWKGRRMEKLWKEECKGLDREKQWQSDRERGEKMH